MQLSQPCRKLGAAARRRAHLRPAPLPLRPRSANNGVDVSGGRVTKAFEVIPSMAEPIVRTNLTAVSACGGGAGLAGARG